MIRRRTKDILVWFTIPLPQHWWRRPHKHTPEARRNMSVAQQKRRATAILAEELAQEGMGQE